MNYWSRFKLIAIIHMYILFSVVRLKFSKCGHQCKLWTTQQKSMLVEKQREMKAKDLSEQRPCGGHGDSRIGGERTMAPEMRGNCTIQWSVCTAAGQNVLAHWHSFWVPGCQRQGWICAYDLLGYTHGFRRSVNTQADSTTGTPSAEQNQQWSTPPPPHCSAN